MAGRLFRPQADGPGEESEASGLAFAAVFDAETAQGAAPEGTLGAGLPEIPLLPGASALPAATALPDVGEAAPQVGGSASETTAHVRADASLTVASMPSLAMPPDQAAAPQGVATSATLVLDGGAAQGADPRGELPPGALSRPAALSGSPPGLQPVTRVEAIPIRGQAGLPAASETTRGIPAMPAPPGVVGAPVVQGLPAEVEVPAAAASDAVARAMASTAAPGSPANALPLALPTEVPVPHAGGPGAALPHLRAGDVVRNGTATSQIRAGAETTAGPSASLALRPASTPATAAATPATVSIAPGTTAETTELLRDGEMAVRTGLSGDLGAAASVTGAAPGASAGAPVAAGAPMPPPVAQALAPLLDRLETGRGGQVEIMLDPPELGRIRILVGAGEQGVTLLLQAERGETLELFRRHADALGRALDDAGFAGFTLDFGGGGASGEADQAMEMQVAGADEPSTAPEPRGRSSQAGSAGLDIRL